MKNSSSDLTKDKELSSKAEIERLTTALRDIKKHQESVFKSGALYSQTWIIANKALGF